MSKYIYFQPNEKDIKDKVGDCVIRALCKALDKSWLEVFDNLCKHAREFQCLPNQKPAYEAYLKELGWRYIPAKNKKQKVSEFKSSFDDKDFYILYVRVGYQTHMVTSDKHNYYDTWDCGNKYIYGYFIKEA